MTKTPVSQSFDISLFYPKTAHKRVNCSEDSIRSIAKIVPNYANIIFFYKILIILQPLLYCFLPNPKYVWTA